MTPPESSASPRARTDPLTALTAGSLAGLLALLTSGLLLAMAGLHHAWLQAPLALIMAVALYRLLPHRAPQQWPRGVVATVLLVAAVVAITNGALRSELVIAGRDGATYANTASFLVEGDDLFPRFVEEPFVGSDLAFRAPGFVLREDGTAWQQFLHSTPAMYAFAGELFGKQALFLVNAILAGVGVLVLFGLASRLMPAWWAVLAAALTSLTLPYIFYSRGTFSEIAALTLSMGGLWVGHLALTNRPAFGLGAGLLLGGAVLVRVDAWMMGVSLGLLLAASIWHGEDDAAEIARRVYLGFVVGGALSLIDLAFFAEPYFVNLGERAFMVVGAAIGARLVAPIARMAPFQRLRSVAARHARITGGAVMSVLAAGLGYLWLIRPLVAEIPGAAYGLADIQIRESLAVDATRSYAELSGWWIAWYVGIPVMVLGLIGAITYARRSIERESAAHRLIFFAVLVPAAVYLVTPSVNPDHIWAIRRFLPVVIPLLVVLAVASLADLSSRLRRVRFGRQLAGALTMAAVIPILVISGPLLLRSDRSGMADQMLALCDSIEGHGSVLLIDDDPELPLSWLLGPPLRSWCHVSVAGTTPGAAHDAAPDVVIASHPALLTTPAEKAFVFHADIWRRTLTKAPREIESLEMEIWIDEG